MGGATEPSSTSVSLQLLQQPAPQLRVEAHLLESEGDLYGSEMELMFVEKLRDEQKFSSLDELRAQIVRDIAAARQKF